MLLPVDIARRRRRCRKNIGPQPYAHRDDTQAKHRHAHRRGKHAPKLRAEQVHRGQPAKTQRIDFVPPIAIQFPRQES